jgi:hypothetical protein
VSETKKTKKESPLTAKQRKFAHEYFNGKTGTDAVIAAGYNTTSRPSSSAVATHLLDQPKVQNYIQQLVFQKYPDAPNLVLERMVHIVSSATSKDSDAISAAKFIIDLCALKPTPEPKKNVNLNLSAKDLELPKE